MKVMFIFLFFIFSLSSCHTMHFSKGSGIISDEYEYTKWHHIGLLGLMEFSKPVNLKQICSQSDGKWSAVRTQTGVLQGLVRIFYCSFSVK